MKPNLAPSSEQWPIAFEKEKARLLRTLRDWIIDIQHIGSTAIPGLIAKPVIDIMIGVNNLEDADLHCVSKIQNLDYVYIKEYERDLPQRRYFQKTSETGVRTHQIHLVVMDSDWCKRRLLFRDYLRSHPDTAQEYGKLKQLLAEKYLDANAYASAKTPFIRKIETIACEEER